MLKTDKRKGKRVIRERRPIQTPGLSLSLDEAIELVKNVKRAANVKPRTLRDYDTHLGEFKRWLTDNYGPLTVDKLSTDILREYVLWLRNEKVLNEGHPFKARYGTDKVGMSPASVNIRIRILKAFFNVLVNEKVVADNPADALSLMRVEEDTVKPLTDDEVRRLLEAPDQRYYAQFRDYVIIFLILDTGMRINEICSLEIKDIDFKARQIVLPASKNKNRKPRILPLSSESVKLLMQLITETKEYFDSDYVFNTYYGEPLNEKTIQKALKKYAQKAGITRNVTPHVLRHNFAKMAALNGMDIFTLQRILGHQEISTTRKYVQLDDEDIRLQHNQYSPIRRILKRK